MRYSAFEAIITPIRMGRYLTACKGNSRKAMTLYRKNLQLSQELFTVISCFEVARPASTPGIQYNASYIFAELVKINDLRNRVAHHEPICFIPRQPVKDITYARQHYNMILKLFQWMQIDEASLLYGLDHISNICEQIDAL